MTRYCEHCEVLVLIDQTTVKCPECGRVILKIDDIVEAVMK